MESPRSNDVLEDVKVSAVVKDALAEARELLQLDFEIAKQELGEELRQVKKAAMTGAAALIFVVLALAALVVAVIVAAGATVGAAVVVATILAVLGGGFGALAYSMAPKSPFRRTRRRLKNDLKELKEHVA